MSGGTRVDIQLAEFEAALPSLRPEIHRYCARMIGSVIEGEDVLQEALYNASRALRDGVEVRDYRAWLFRIAHNAALNLLRSRKTDLVMKEELSHSAPLFDQMPKHSETSDNLRPFLGLTPRQRSTVILRDVLGYSASEVADMIGGTVQSVKSALHRGRALLKVRSDAAPESHVALSAAQREQLAGYARLFNAHDFDRLREMLSAEVRLDLVSVENRSGAEAVGGYFGNYQKKRDWLMAPGRVEGRMAILAFDPDDPSGPPKYFVLIDFDGANIASIRDFRYARYVMADAQWERFEASGER
jgi:RNA polymerase sigma-70 factor (ECF subfamily)